MTLSLRGQPISTDGSGRIVITDINPDGDNDEDALFCLSEMIFNTPSGDWFLHPTQQTTQRTNDGSVRIESTDNRGWHRSRVINIVMATHRQVRLKRDDSIASGGRALEGVFTCHIPGDTNTPVSVGIYYPSELHVKSFTLRYILLLLCTLLYIYGFVFSKCQLIPL